MTYEGYQRRSLLSSEPARINLELGENVTNDTGGLSSSIRLFRHCPVAVSHIRHKPSKLQDTISVPSRLNCTAVTGSECAGNTLRPIYIHTHIYIHICIYIYVCIYIGLYIYIYM